MKKIITYSLLLAVITGAVSCNDWLDVDQKTKVKSKVLLENEQGFRDALIGIYTNMISEELYGRELTYGFFEALTGAYDIPSQNTNYYYVSQGELNNTAVKAKTDRMWEGLYNVIVNVNNILDNIDSKRNVFSGDMYEVIKGESLALRAFLHLQVFKIFGDAADLTKDAIPYITTLDNKVVSSCSGGEILRFIMDDLEAAMVLLMKDPVYTDKTKTNNNDAFMNDRQMRMNYFAAMAVYAETALWAKDTGTALEYAKKVISACDELFPWIDPATVTVSEDKNRDFTFSTEHIFCVNVYNMTALYTTWLSPEARDSHSLYKGSYYFNQWFQSTTVGSQDYRYVYLKKAHLLNSNNNVGLKFSQPEKYVSAYSSRIPIIRRSLMYYIAAECETDPVQAKYYLNEVRKHRGISEEIVAYSEIELRREYIKEFWEEGHLFFFHKRRNIEANPTDRWLPFILSQKYVIAKPDAEIEYGK